MSDIEDLEGADEPDTDLVVETISSDRSSLAYGIYTKLRVYLYHYNALKMKYKIITSTWLFATFIGFGYIVSGEAMLPLSNLLSGAFLCWLASIGICLLWFMDVGVYHQLLEAVFVEALEMEKKFPHLLHSSCQNMVSLLGTNKRDPVLYDSLYYAVSSLIIFLTGGASLTLYLYETYPIGSLVGMAFFILFALGVEGFLLSLAKNSQKHEGGDHRKTK